MNLLLLRGLAREQRHWGPFPEKLASALAAATGAGQVATIDLPGAGTEHLRTCPTSIAEITEDVRGRFVAVQHNYAPGPWCLMGISLGGMVAMDWAARHGEDFAGVVLVNTSAGDLSAPWRRMSPRVVPSVIRALVERDPIARERRILGFTTRIAGDLDAVAERWAALQTDRPMARTNVLRQLSAATRFRAPKAIAIPTLVIAGAHDPLADPACAGRLAERFDAPLVVHPTAGHDMSLDAPDWLSHEVAQWIAGGMALKPVATAHA